MKKNTSFIFDTRKKTESIVKQVHKHVLTLKDNERNGIIKHFWEEAINNRELPIYSYTQILLKSGVSDKTLMMLLGLLVDTGIDISDPLSSSSELSVIVGYMSNDLLGMDLSQMRRVVDEVKNTQVTVNNKNYIIPKIKIPNGYLPTYQYLKQIRRFEQELILSKKIPSEISKNIIEINDTMIMRLLMREIIKIWSELGVNKKSKAVIYFRSMKVYASDLDIYYWGPQKEKVLKKLTKYLIPLGYKIDHCALYFIDSIIKNKAGVNNAYLGGYLYDFFFIGNYLEFNGGKYFDYYRKDILPAMNMSEAWPSIYNWFMKNIDVMSDIFQKDLKEYPSFKNLITRTLEGILLGLALKYKAPDTLNYKNLFKYLKRFLDKEDVNILEDAVHYVNHIRDVYQQITERRWEMIYPETIKQINNIIERKVNKKIEDKIPYLARHLKRIVYKYIDIPSNVLVVKSFEQYKLEAPYDLTDFYAKVSLLYKEIASEK